MVFYFKVKKNEFFFFIAYILLIIYRVLKSSTLGINDKGITYIIISMLFLGRIIMLNRVKKKKIFVFLAIMLIVAGNIMKIADPVVPIVFLALIASKDIEFDNIVKISFNVVAILVFIVVVLSIIGLIPNTLSYRYFNGIPVRCHGMGFNHSSTLPTYYYYLFLEYFYLKKEKMKSWKLVLWILGGYLIYQCCGVRLRFYLIFITAFLLFFESLIQVHLSKMINCFVTICFPIFCILKLGSAYFYDSFNIIMYKLNILLSNRLYLENYALNNYPISIFGNEIDMGEGTIYVNNEFAYFYLDSAYIYILIVYGILITFFIMSLYTCGAIKAVKLQNYALMIWFLVVAIDSTIGNQLMSIWIIPILFLLFSKIRIPDKRGKQSTEQCH